VPYELCVFSHTHGTIFLSLSLLPHMLSRSVTLLFSHGTLSPIRLSPVRLSPKLRVVATTLSPPVHGGVTLLLPSSSTAAAARGSVARERGDCGTPFFFHDDLLLPPECRLPSNGPPPFFVIGHRGSYFFHGTAPSSSVTARSTREIHEGGPRRRNGGRPEATLAGVDLAAVESRARIWARRA
jgi:hypothetical protein